MSHLKNSNTTTLVNEKKKKKWNNATTRIFLEQLDMLHDEYQSAMLKAIDNPHLNKKCISKIIGNYQRVNKAIDVLRKTKKYVDHSEFNEFVRNGGTYR